MPRPSKKAAERKQTNSLLTALEFIANAQRNLGTQLQTHCIVKDGWAVASDSILTMGCKVPDELNACPQTTRLVTALRRCGDTVALTQLDANRIAVKSGNLRVVVPCVELSSMAVMWADPMIAPLGQAFLDGCRAIGHLASDGGQSPHLCSILARGQTLSATTGRVLAEYWHGFDTPPYWVIPKPAITALLKITKPLIGMGYSGNSVSFFFEDESWLRTQLYEDKWPNTEKLFETTGTNKSSVPETLFAAVEILSEFASTGSHIEFKEESLHISAIESERAEYQVVGLQGGVTFALKDLQQISKISKTLDYNKGDRMAFFTSDRLRGAIGIISTGET